MRHKAGVASMIGLTIFLCSGWTAPQACQTTPAPANHDLAIGVSVVAVIAVGTIVLVAVHHEHHTVKGCVFADNGKLRLVDDGSQKTYELEGVTPNVRPGDIVKLHGDKLKMKKGSAEDQKFVVQHLSKDFGPCKNVPAPAAP
jgi:hypothetical protein